MAEQRKKGKQVNFRLTDELAERFEDYCKERGITMTQFLENSIRQALGQPLTIPQDALGISQRIATGEDRKWGEKLKEIETRLAQLERPSAPRMELEEPSTVTLSQDEASAPIEKLQLSQRAYNVLKRAQINTISDLLEYTQDEMLGIKNLGSKSRDEVIEALERRTGFKIPERRDWGKNTYQEFSPEEQREQLRAEREGKSERVA